MSEQEKSIVRACLEQVHLGMYEAREVRNWWMLLSEVNRQAWKEFAAFLANAEVELRGPGWPMTPP